MHTDSTNALNTAYHAAMLAARLSSSAGSQLLAISETAHTMTGLLDFGRLLDNLVFMADLRKQNRVGFLRLDTVVQAANFREMPAIVEIGMALGFDRVHFQLIRNWGTFSREEFMRHAIGAADHPDHKAFLDVLEHPNLGRPLVSLGELSSLRRGPVPATRAWWA